MEKIIWIINNKRDELIDAQRKINSGGGMRAVCMISSDALMKHTGIRLEEGSTVNDVPALILIDYNMACAEHKILDIIKNNIDIAGVPLFFMVNETDDRINEDCRKMGAQAILKKPFSVSELMQIERSTLHQESVRSYERILEKQTNDIIAAKEIMRLNKKLKARNDFLYQLFGRYFSDDVLEVILSGEDGATIGGEKRNVTILMADLRGFSSTAENMLPENVTDMLNRFFGTIIDIVGMYNGTIIEFMGDGVLCVFGAPVHTQLHREDAVAAAITMQNAMEDINDFCREKGYPRLNMGIGIHSGDTFIGNVGSDRMMRFNVLGSTVNECSRIEGMSLSGQVLVSGETLEAVKLPVKVASVREVLMKGLRRATKVCEVTGIEGEYNCFLKNNEEMRLMPVNEKLYFHMYPLENKIVGEKYICGRLVEFSREEAGVSSENELAQYSDIYIKCIDEEKNIVFDGVYAKVIEFKDRVFMLHFTYTNNEFERLAGRIAKWK